MDNNKIRYGLIGLGEVSIPHENGYRESMDKVEITAVCDVNRQVAEARAEPYNATAYTDYRVLLNDPRIEAVDIMVPHYLHYPIAKEALIKKKHVIIEKPLAVTPNQALDLCNLAKQQGVKFTVAENTRFVTAYQEAEKLICNNAIGTPRLIRTLIYGTEMIRIQDRENWIHRKEESGGGALIDMAAHTIYLIKWLFGDIEELQAFQWNYVPNIETADNAVINGLLSSGAIFTTQYTETVEVPWGERLEVYGDLGSIIIDQLNNPPAKFYENAFDFYGRPIEAVPYNPAEWKYDSIKAEVIDFIQAIWYDRPPAIDPMEGYYVINAIDKAYESINSGKPIRI